MITIDKKNRKTCIKKVPPALEVSISKIFVKHIENTSPTIFPNFLQKNKNTLAFIIWKIDKRPEYATDIPISISYIIVLLSRTVLAFSYSSFIQEIHLGSYLDMFLITTFAGFSLSFLRSPSNFVIC